MKITTTAGTLKKGDKIGRRVVVRSEFRNYNLGYHVFFEDSGVPEPYGRDEPITVELAHPGGWYLRSIETRKFWHPIGSFYSEDRPKRFDDKDVADLFMKSEEERLPHELAGELEVVFLGEMA